MKERDDDSQRLSYGTPQLFSFEELKSFTSNLKKNVGFGGFGDVYKGKFSNGVKIAVKVLKENTKDVMIKQFMAEVSTMGSISHPNLIKLYGYCFDIDMKALVYEYMKFGSLDKILFKNHIDIEWEKLYNIAVGIADGLSFLHEECRPRIIHYDIKPDNVLIDSNYSPKIIDFGMARHSSQAEQSGFRGTNSYAAPEVGKGRLVTYKSDVYSFGMMMFEILRKKRNSVGPGWFPGEVAQKVENDELDEIILVCGIEEKNKEKAEKLSLVALWCTQEKHFRRPDMSSVVKMLKGEMRLEKPPNPFGFYDYSPESSVAGYRPLPKFSPAVTEGSRERAADLTKITSVHSGSSSTSKPPSKIIPNNDLKREIRPGQNAPLQKEQIKEYFSPQGNLIGGSTRIDGRGALSHFSPALTEVPYEENDQESKTIPANMEFNSSSTFKPVDPRRSGFNIDSQKEKRLQVRDDQTGNTSIEKVAYTYEMLLEKFPKKCPPGGNNSVVLYTSLDVMGDTNRVRSTFQNLQINYSLRDIINPAYEEELRNLLGELAELPALFVKGRYIGGTNEVQKLNKEGKLNILLAGATGSTFKAARGDQKGNGFEIDRIWEPPLESTPVDMKISSNRYTWEMLLEKFPKKCPPGGDNSVVLYTSLEVMGDTNRIRSTFQNIRINYSVRNISNLDYEEELTELLGKVEVPALFVQGRYIGGINEVQKLNKEGKLKILFGGIPKY